MNYLKQMVECSFKNQVVLGLKSSCSRMNCILIMSRFEESLFCICNLLLPPVCAAGLYICILFHLYIMHL